MSLLMFALGRHNAKYGLGGVPQSTYRNTLKRINENELNLNLN
jgi:hypothetical protein